MNRSLLTRTFLWMGTLGFVAFERGEIVGVCRDGAPLSWQQMALLAVITVGMVFETCHVFSRFDRWNEDHPTAAGSQPRKRGSAGKGQRK